MGRSIVHAFCVVCGKHYDVRMPLTDRLITERRFNGPCPQGGCPGRVIAQLCITREDEDAFNKACVAAFAANAHMREAPNGNGRGG